MPFLLPPLPTPTPDPDTRGPSRPAVLNRPHLLDELHDPDFPIAILIQLTQNLLGKVGGQLGALRGEGGPQLPSVDGAVAVAIEVAEEVQRTQLALLHQVEDLVQRSRVGPISAVLFGGRWGLGPRWP